jgi:CHAD domain-containing protein
MVTMVSVGQKLRITAKRGRNKVVSFSKEITEAKAEILKTYSMFKPW